MLYLATKCLLPVALFMMASGANAEGDGLDPLHATRISPEVHMLGTAEDYSGAAIGNITIIEQGDGLVLVDSGGTAADGRRVVSYIRSWTDKPVKAILITHWHNDHPMGISAIRDVWPDVRIIATHKTQHALLTEAIKFVSLQPDPQIETAALNAISSVVSTYEAAARDSSRSDASRARSAAAALAFRNRMPDIAGTYLVLPTELFEEELVLDDPEVPVRLLHLGRGNTSGDAIAWLPRQRVLVAGDLVVSPVPFGFSGYTADWVDVLNRMKEMNFNILIPGHGLPQRDGAYLDRIILSLQDIRVQAAEMARLGLSLDQARESFDYARQKELFGIAPDRAAAFEGSWLRPLVEIAYKEATGEQIHQDGE